MSGSASASQPPQLALREPTQNDYETMNGDATMENAPIIGNNFIKIVIFKGLRLNDLPWFEHSKIRTLGDNSADSPEAPHKSSFETVILPAKFLNMATNRTEDIASFYKFSASHIEYYDKPAEMPFLRPATSLSFRHKRVNTTVDNVRKLFGDSVATVPNQLDLYLYKYSDKVFWAVKLGRVFVIVKGAGMCWRPWMGPELGFSELGIVTDVHSALKLASERNAVGSGAGRFRVARLVSTGPVYGVQASFRL
jgi:hypothetical protein